MKYVSGYEGNFNPNQSLIIADGDTESDVLSCGGFTLVGVKLPAVFTGTALTFEMCDTVDGTFVSVCDDQGTPVSVTVAQDTYAAIDPSKFYGINFLKIVSGDDEEAERTLICSLKGF